LLVLHCIEQQDKLDSQCDGYGFSTFSSIVACLALIGAAVLSQTARVERDDSAGATPNTAGAIPAEAFTVEDNGKETVQEKQEKQEDDGANV
jgi:hypothetical protein